MTKARTLADNFAADINGITAGTGITGGGTSGTVTVTNSMATAIDAAGDLIYGTGSDAFTRLGIGTAGQVLKVNSGATAPEWGAVSGGYTLVSRQTYTSAGTITLDNIFSTTYENYQIVLLMGNSNETADLTMKFRYGASPTTQSQYYNWDYQINAANGGTSTVAGSEDGSNIRIVADTGSQLAVHMFISSFSDRLWGGYFATGYSNNAGAGPNGYRGNFNNRFARSGADAYHGLLFELSAGTATGNISIYGQAK